MFFRTPMDDWDLEVIPMPTPVPRLKLSPPISYLSLLPPRAGDAWEIVWSYAKTASHLLAIAKECSEYHTFIRRRLETFTPDSSPSPELGPTDTEDPKSKISIIDINLTISDTVNAWYKLAEQAETLENHLLSIPSRQDTAISFVDNSVVSRVQLQDQLNQIQTLADEKIAELDEKGADAHNKLGIGSPHMAALKDQDLWRHFKTVFVQGEDEELKEQMKEHGVFGWWVAQMAGELEL